MKIFVSYARVDKPYCIRIIETLHAHDVWYDQRLYAGQDWWKEILRRLDWCEAFIYLLSPESVRSLYCRRELGIARRLKRAIIPVRIKHGTALPAEMQNWQYVDLADSLTVENVSQLLNSILMVERQKAAAPPAPTPAPPQDGPLAASSPVEWVSGAVRALEQGDYDQSILLLKQAQASGYQPRFIRLDKLLRAAEAALAEKTREREYQHIAALFASENTRPLACESLAKFMDEFAGYDPQGLQQRCQSNLANAANPAKIASAPRPSAIQPQSSAPPSKSTRPAAPPKAQRSGSVITTAAVLPMLRWCDVPYGSVVISSIEGADEDFGEITVPVDNFVMSMFPVTNAQFQIFTQAADGYQNPRWWAFSEAAQQWFNLGKGPSKSRFSGDNHPRENVNWYEAMAFANWLSSLLKMKITLPTVAQWQRAAKGDDDRYFPWGNDYHEEHCNTRESGIKMTTPVDRYAKGTSPYGIYDMAGNVWEWTLNTASPSEGGRDRRRAVAGGSFVSTGDRAQTSCRYYLDPRVGYSSIGIRLVGLT